MPMRVEMTGDWSDVTGRDMVVWSITRLRKRTANDHVDTVLRLTHIVGIDWLRAFEDSKRAFYLALAPVHAMTAAAGFYCLLTGELSVESLSDNANVSMQRRLICGVAVCDIEAAIARAVSDQQGERQAVGCGPGE